VGDIVTFYSKKYGDVKIKVSKVMKVNLQGNEVNGVTSWRVRASLCKKVK
jgi:hypothetical protein